MRSPLVPTRTAVVTSELQRGVVGDHAVFPALAEAATAADLVGTVVRLCDAARAAGAHVVHGVAHRRPDGRGANTNARLFAAAAKADVVLAPDSDAAALVDGLHRDTDLVSTRFHGLNPMAGTDLDPLLRNLGVDTVVVAGVSVNVAVTNLVMDAVNRGYRVVLPRDAVVGMPIAYAEAVIDTTLSLLAEVTTTDAVVDALTG